MENQYFTINAKGRAEIVEFLNKYHKRPSDQNINAWVEDAETNMANNGPECATIEIPSFNTISGHTETLTIEVDALSSHDVEE